jgi:hypothetical protein
MLPAATVHLIDRLVAALMSLVEAVAPSLTPSIDPALPQAAAHSLLFRLTNLVVRLIGISNVGVRTPAKREPESPSQPAPAANPGPPSQYGRAAPLPRRPGWLLAALPELAPPIAAEIGALLADPAIATLLDLDPSLRRTLRPLLRALGLSAPTPLPTPPPSPPSSSTHPDGAPPPTPTAPPPHQPPPPTPAPKLALPTPEPFHVPFVPIS